METSHGTRRRNLLLVLAALGAIVVILVVVAVVQLLEVRSSLDGARASIARIESTKSDLLTRSGRTSARRTLVHVRSEARGARRTLEGSAPLSWVGHLPVLGTQTTGLGQLASDLASTSQASIRLLDDVQRLDASSQGSSISLPALRMLRTDVATTASTLAGLDRSGSGLLWPVSGARQRFNEKARQASADMRRGDEILGYAISFLGGDGPRRYLLAAENTSEMRDQGSPLSIGQLTTVEGKIDSEGTAPYTDYPLSGPVDVPIPAGTQSVFGIDRPTQLWQNANVTADFPFSGSVLRAMYLQATGTADDGVVALDVHALAGLLTLTGPVVVDGIAQPVTAQNVTYLLMHQLYVTYPASPDQSERKVTLAAVASAVVHRISEVHVDPAALVHVLSNEVAGRHLLLWDATAANEDLVRRYGASGAIDSDLPSRTFHLAVENATATKLDFYLHTAIHQNVLIEPGGTARIYTTVTVRNDAPAGQRPSYQLGPDNNASHTPGQYVGPAYLWVPRGAEQQGATAESGLQVVGGNVDLLPGERTTLRFSTTIPHALRRGSLDLRWVPQPEIRPQRLSIDVLSNAGRLSGPRHLSTLLQRTTVFHWGK